MKLIIIVYLVIALITFIGILVYTELSTSDFVKGLAYLSGKSYINYGRVLLLSLFWIFTLALILIMIIVEVIASIIRSSKSD